MQYYLSYRSNPGFNVGFHDFHDWSSLYTTSAISLGNLFSNEIYSAGRAVHIEEGDEGYVLTLELPGYKQSHLDVSLDEDILTIVAKKDEHNQYEHSVILPSDIDPDKIEAKLEDGILTVKIGKVEQAKPRKISVN